MDHGYAVSEVSERLGVSTHRLYKWVKAVKPDKSEQQATELIEAKSEILKLRAQLRRTEEKRDILKMAAWYFAKDPQNILVRISTDLFLEILSTLWKSVHPPRKSYQRRRLGVLLGQELCWADR